MRQLTALHRPSLPARGVMDTVARARGGVMLRSRFTVITTPRAVAGAVKRGATTTPRQARLGEARGVDDVSCRLRHNSPVFTTFCV